MAYQGTAPNPQGYNIWGPSLAASFAAQTGNPGADGLRRLAMAMMARNEQGGYAAALQQANDMAMQAAMMEDAGKTRQTYIEHGDDWVKAGAGGALIPPAGTVQNPDVIDQASVVHLDNTAAQSFQRQAEGLGTLATETRYLPTAIDPATGKSSVAAGVGQYITNPLQPNAQTTMQYIDPIEQQEADAKTLQVQASMRSANRPVGGGGGGSDGSIQTVMEIDPITGRPRFKFTGKGMSADELAAAANVPPPAPIAPLTTNRRYTPMINPDGSVTVRRNENFNKSKE